MQEKAEALASEGRQLGYTARGVEKMMTTIALIVQDLGLMYYKRRREKSDVDCVGIPEFGRLGVCDDEIEEVKVSVES